MLEVHYCYSKYYYYSTLHDANLTQATVLKYYITTILNCFTDPFLTAMNGWARYPKENLLEILGAELYRSVASVCLQQVLRIEDPHGPLFKSLYSSTESQESSTAVHSLVGGCYDYLSKHPLNAAEQQFVAKNKHCIYSLTGPSSCHWIPSPLVLFLEA